MAPALSSLLSHPAAPGFIYLHHPHAPTSAVLRAFPDKVIHARVSAIEYTTPRLLYSGLLHRLAEAGGSDWDGGEVSTWDGFARGLRIVRDSTRRMTQGKQGGSSGTRKGKAKETASDRAVELVNGHVDGNGEEADLNWVVVVTHAERLPRILGAQWAVLTRMAELVGIPLTVVLVSQTPWDTLRPPSADAPEPLHIYIPAFTRSETQIALLGAGAHPLWPHFLNLFLATLLPLAPALQDLAYLARPLWELYTSSLPPHAESYLLQIAGSSEALETLASPKLEITVKLLTDLKFALSLPLTLAIEHLLPRHISPRAFVQHLRQNTSNPLLAGKRGVLPSLPGLEIPLLGKYLVVAGYLASQNPAKSDLRLFGRGLGADGRRKKGGGTRRAGYGRLKVGKVPQRLLGPKPFPLDRLLAIFSSLYTEHAERPPDLLPALGEDEDDQEDSDLSSSSSRSSRESENDENESMDSPSLSKRRKPNGVSRHSNTATMVERQRKRVERRRNRDMKREERWEEEVEGTCMSVKLWSMIPELEIQGVMKRVSPPDRLDNVMLRCEVDYEGAKGLARELKMTLDDYLYEAQV